MFSFFIIILRGLLVCIFQGYDPLAHEKFKPRFKKRGKSAAGAVEKRKKKVAYEDQRVFNYTQTTFSFA